MTPSIDGQFFIIPNRTNNNIKLKYRPIFQLDIAEHTQGG